MFKLLSLFFFLTSASYAQNQISIEFMSKTKLTYGDVVGFNNFGKLIYLNNNSLYKEQFPENASYANIQLGKIFSANAFNPLKINVFYKDFNTVIILDNRLNEIYSIDFNATQPYKYVTYVSTGYDNTIWIYNQDSQELEVYDYKQNKTRVKTLPIADPIIDLKSNYNFSWALTKNHILSYNYFGSMALKMQNNGYTELAEVNENLFLKKENELFYLSAESKEITPVKLPKLLIKAFFVKDETLYIYDGEFLHQYQIKTN